MDFFKINKLRKALKHNKPEPEEQQQLNKHDANTNNNTNTDASGKQVDVNNHVTTEADEDDDDFIMNEVKRRLKELKRNSFMVLIPEEETCPEEDEMEMEMEMEDLGEASSNEWRDVEEEGRRLWSCFGAFYDKYCERMLSFDRVLIKHIGKFLNLLPLNFLFLVLYNVVI